MRLMGIEHDEDEDYEGWSVRVAGGATESQCDQARAIGIEVVECGRD